MPLVTASSNRELDEILDLLGLSVQLTQTQFDRAETSYYAVAEWLRAPDSLVRVFGPEIFAQGSLRLDTTVRPLSYTEFDLDLVCLVHVSDQVKPAVVYDLLLQRMRDHGIYKNLIVELPRCIRLDYAGDFHLDIVPAIPDPACPPGDTCIKIPDRPLQQWRDSNPKGYSRWFEEQSAKRLLLEKAAQLSANANVEPLQDPAPAYLKPPLKLAVQLFKRWRDVVFRGRESLAPSSIVLTTLAGMLYQGEHHPTDALATILDGIDDWSLQVKQIELRNPSNPKECITDRWKAKPEMYEAFIEAAGDFRIALHTLINDGRYPDCIDDLKELFGDWPVTQAFTKFAERRKEASASGRLLMQCASGILTITPTSLVPASAPGFVKGKGHTFHGA
jgi:hypothetical protein